MIVALVEGGYPFGLSSTDMFNALTRNAQRSAAHRMEAGQPGRATRYAPTAPPFRPGKGESYVAAFRAASVTVFFRPCVADAGGREAP